MCFRTRNVLKFSFDKCSSNAVVTVIEVVQASFNTKNVLNFNFPKCRGSLILMDSCFSAGKMR